MFYQIVQTIQQQLSNNLGSNSSYANDKVEFVDTKIPEAVTVNRLISIAKRRKEQAEYVVGQSPSLTFIYNVDIIVYTKHLNYDAGEKSLEVIEKRLIKNMSDRTQPIYSLEDSSDNMNEQVLTVKLVNVDYDSGLWSDNNWAHIAIFTYQIATMFQL